ncbi:multiheme c-type cytochrome [Candidatus Latescibacterota bacterium]
MNSVNVISVITISLMNLVPFADAQTQQQEKTRYFGDTVCATCHITQTDSFQKSPHIKAYTTIKDTERYIKLKKEGKEGSCLKCHVTGYGENGGYTDDISTPELAKVGCEGCHGPGSAHAKLSKDEVDLKKQTIKRKPDCGKCHLIHSHEK